MVGRRELGVGGDERRVLAADRFEVLLARADRHQQLLLDGEPALQPLQFGGEAVPDFGERSVVEQQLERVVHVDEGEHDRVERGRPDRVDQRRHLLRVAVEPVCPENVPRHFLINNSVGVNRHVLRQGSTSTSGSLIL